ncbi:TetR/AcrR family transcriptional regulator [Dactylosporangium sp. CS-033363]|uniref:TetR/AcrR family transcriptional regulator n=1 Tax=Dactylosporangium sp. CS-033363 TaxID=3239935 RepID=UPI003D942BA1
MTTVRREDILLVAARLFAHNGVASSTVREIADAAGLMSGSLYHHFDSKAAMVEAIVMAFLHDLQGRYAAAVRAAAGDPRECLGALIRASFAAVDAHPYATEIYQNDRAFLRALPSHGRLRAVALDVQQTWLDVLAAGIAGGRFRGDVPPAVLYRLIRDAVWRSVHGFTPTPGYSRARLAADCTAIFLDGIAPARPSPRPSVVGAAGAGDQRVP